jgi:Domain of unknown function (DUF3854)
LVHVLVHSSFNNRVCGATLRYLNAQGCRALFFGPTQNSGLADTSVPVVIVEAEKSALAMSALADRHGRRLLAIAAGGVWGWRRNVGMELQPDGTHKSVSGPSPSLDWVTWDGHKVTVVFDSNVAGRRDLEKARRDFAVELRRRKANVLIASVPGREGMQMSEFFDTTNEAPVKRPEQADDIPDALKPHLYARKSRLPFAKLLPK